jgi:hypothetical protein
MKKLFVLLAAVVFVVAFTAPSFAAEWSFYGSARMEHWWTDRDYGDGNVPGIPDADDDFDLTSSGLVGNGRIGANVKVSDNLIGRFEYSDSVTLRLLYGEYDFGGFKLGVGQNYNPFGFFYSTQAYAGDVNMLGTGGVYTGRDPAVWGKFGGFTVSLMQVNVASVGETDTDIVLPQIQAGYNFSIAGLSIKLAGGYQAYDVVDANDDDDDLTAWMLAIGASYNMGPFYIAGDYWTGQNTGNLGQASFGFAPDIFASADADGVLDNDSYGFLLVAAFTLSDMLRFEAGYGYVNADLDDAAEEDETSAYYLACKINLAKGVYIQPEIGHYDLADDAAGDDEGDVTYYGLRWQINF